MNVNVAIQIEVDGKWSTIDQFNTPAHNFGVVAEHFKVRVEQGAADDQPITPLRVIVGPERPDDAETCSTEADVRDSLATNW